ncbi:MAG: replicative DNA helicase, partial [Verrucomicrobiaceae bacterium]
MSTTEAPRNQRSRKSGDGSNGDLQNKVSYMPDIHRMLPASPDAEQGVLASFLLAPREVGGLCAEKGIKAEAFHIPAHGTIYATLIEMWDANRPVDFITLTEVLRSRNQLDQVGGAAFVTSLFTFLPTAANASYYIDILQEKYTLREIIKVCTDYAARSYDETNDVQTLLNDVEAAVFTIAQERFKDRSRGMKEQVMEAIASIQDLYERRGGITGIPSGFADLDKMTDGLHRQEMIVIAARPSMGKTAFAMNIAEYIAVDLKMPVAVFSLEMGSQQLVQRLLCSRAKVNLGRVRDGFLSERDFPALTAAASKLAESKIFIDDTAGLSIL